MFRRRSNKHKNCPGIVSNNFTCGKKILKQSILCSDCSRTKYLDNNVPSPEEMARITAEIQKTWSRREEMKRRGYVSKKIEIVFIKDIRQQP